VGEAASTAVACSVLPFGIGSDRMEEAQRRVKARKWNMDREEFAKVAEEVLDSLPQEFRRRIRNVAVLVEDLPPGQVRTPSGPPRKLLQGLFHGVPVTKKSVFNLPTGPDYVVLYQKNIEAVCSTEAEIREQIRLTVIHELGHFFGMDEEQLKNV
jgi:predicted Zn-dependent protease with MMP-like domain